MLWNYMQITQKYFIISKCHVIARILIHLFRLIYRNSMSVSFIDNSRKGVKGDYKSTVYYMRRYGTETTCLLCNYGELHWHLYV